MSIDVRFKSNSLPGAKVDTLEKEEKSNQNMKAVDGSEWEGDTWGIEVPGTESETETVSNPLDAYMFNDTHGLKANVSGDTGLNTLLDNFPPTLEQVRQADPRVDMMLDVVLNLYIQSAEDLRTYRQELVNMQQEAALPVDEQAIVSDKIQAIDACLVRIEIEKQLCSAELDSLDNNIYWVELQTGDDMNGDGWIGRPGAPGSFGVTFTASGKKVYIDPITNQVLPNPPLMMPNLDLQVFRGNGFIVDGFQPPEGHPEVDLTIELIDPAGSNGTFDASFTDESRFNTASEIMSTEFFWVETDSPFTPKMKSKGDEFEDYMAPAAFEMGTTENGVAYIRQAIPEDRSRYMQVRVAKITVETYELPGLDGGNHIVTYKDAEDNIIARICIKGFEGGDPNMPWTDSLGNGFASSFGLAINMDGSFTEKLVDLDGVISTARHVVGDGELAAALEGLPDGSTMGQTEGYESYNDNMAIFEQANPLTTGFDLTTYQTISHQRDGTDQGLARDISWVHDAYMPPEDMASKMNGNARENHDWGSGVYVYGEGARGHFIGTKYNDIFMLADVHNIMSREEYTDVYSNLEATDRADPLYQSVVIAGAGNNILRAYGGDLYAEGITLSWIDANHDDNVYIKTQGPENQLSADFDDQGNVESAPINYLNYVHVDAQGGIVHIANPDENVADLVSESSSDNNQTYDWQEAPWAHSMLGDYYDINAGTVGFTNLDDPDVINSVGSMSLSGPDGGLNGMHDWRDAAIAEIEDAITRQGIDEIDESELQALRDGWTSSYGVHTQQLQQEMDEIFGTIFGDTDSIMNEMAMDAAESGL
jgi:hypothetical protein